MQDYYLAYYGAKAPEMPDFFTLSMSIPQEQSYAENSVARGVMPLLGRWIEGEEQVLFKPVAGVFRVPLYAPNGERIARVELVSKGQKMSGAVLLDDLTLPDDYNVADPSAERADTYAVDEANAHAGVALTGDIAPGATPDAAANLCFIAASGDYKEGFTLNLTDADGNTMTCTKAAVDKAELRPGQLQPFAPLAYVQRAPELVLTPEADDPGRITARLKDFSQIEPDMKFRYWIDHNGGGSQWFKAVYPADIVFGEDTQLLLHEVLEEASHILKNGYTCRLWVEMTDGSGAVYTRSYEFEYRVPKGPEIEATLSIGVVFQSEGFLGKLLITVNNPEEFFWDPEGLQTWVQVDGSGWGITNTPLFNSNLSWNEPVITVANVFNWQAGQTHTVQIGCCDEGGDGVPDHVSDVADIAL